MDANLVKIGTKQEATKQIMVVDKYLGDTIMALEAIEAEASAIRKKQNESADGRRLKEIARLRRALRIEQYMAIG